MFNKVVNWTALTCVTIAAVDAKAVTRMSEVDASDVMRFTPTLTDVRAGTLRGLANRRRTTDTPTHSPA